MFQEHENQVWFSGFGVDLVERKWKLGKPLNVDNTVLTGRPVIAMDVRLYGENNDGESIVIDGFFPGLVSDQEGHTFLAAFMAE